MSTQLEKQQKKLLFSLEERTNIPYMLLKKLIKHSENNHTSETSDKERIEEYRSLIKTEFAKKGSI